jgi:hypothetical protein
MRIWTQVSRIAACEPVDTTDRSVTTTKDNQKGARLDAVSLFLFAQMTTFKRPYCS